MIMLTGIEVKISPVVIVVLEMKSLPNFRTLKLCLSNEIPRGTKSLKVYFTKSWLRVNRSGCQGGHRLDQIVIVKTANNVNSHH